MTPESGVVDLEVSAGVVVDLLGHGVDYAQCTAAGRISVQYADHSERILRLTF